MSTDAYVWVDPGRMGGQPCINGTRLTVELVAGYYWHHGLDSLLDAYPLTREQVLVGCWYASRYGRKRWRHRYGDWARNNDMSLWRHDYDDVVDPPRRRS